MDSVRSDVGLVLCQHRRPGRPARASGDDDAFGVESSHERRLDVEQSSYLAHGVERSGIIGPGRIAPNPAGRRRCRSAGTCHELAAPTGSRRRPPPPPGAPTVWGSRGGSPPPAAAPLGCAPRWGGIGCGSLVPLGWATRSVAPPVERPATAQAVHSVAGERNDGHDRPASTATCRSVIGAIGASGEDRAGVVADRS